MPPLGLLRMMRNPQVSQRKALKSHNGKPSSLTIEKTSWNGIPFQDVLACSIYEAPDALSVPVHDLLVEGEDLLALVAEGGFGGVQLGCRVVGRIGHVHAQACSRRLRACLYALFALCPIFFFAAL